MIQEAPRSLDPAQADSVYESLPLNQIFDGLVKLGPSLNVQPALAETWTVTDSGRTYEFNLRRDVLFHNGSELTAGDVAFTIRRALDPVATTRSLVRSYLMTIDGAAEFAAGEAESIRGLEVAGPYTLRIRLQRPYDAFLEVLAMDGAAVVPQAVLESVGQERFARSPVGTGPFRATRWDERSLRLEAYRGHYAGPPLLDSVELFFYADDETDMGTQRFLAGELDVVEPPAELLLRLEQDAQVQFQRHPELSLSFLGLNLSQPPLDLLEVRQAVAHALDRHAIVGDSPEIRREAVGILPPGLAGFSPEPKALEHDPEAARRLLAQAGYAGGAGLPPIRLYTPASSDAARRVGSRIRADLEAVGIAVEVHPVSWSQMNRALDEHSAPAFLLAWIADLTEPDAFLRSLFESVGSENYFSFVDPETDRLLGKGVMERDPVERARLYRQLERHVLVQAPIVPLYHTAGVIAMRSYVRGLQPGPLGLAEIELERVWLAPRDLPL